MVEYRRLGKTPLIVSELGFGAFAIGGNAHGNSYGHTDDRTSRRAIGEAIDQGCTFFDTADVYGRGHSESLLGSTLRELKVLDDVVIATKGGGSMDDSGASDFSLSRLREALEASLRRLGRGYVDLYQLHNPTLEDIRNGNIFEVMADLKTAGLARCVGVSVHTQTEALACLEHPTCESIQLVCNLMSSVVPDWGIDKIRQQAAAKGVGLIAREPLASGYLARRHEPDAVYERGDVRASFSVREQRLRVGLAAVFHDLKQGPATAAQFAIRHVLDMAEVGTTIVGAKTPEQVAENFASIQLPPFDMLYRRALEADRCS
ncbi:aldo/keto reductase [Enhygromyxa salina]|uniref:aldo/keto reductase n=1 Tax=Enhygromyxa salina TaxID=215803 RepID=UPI0011BA96E7|nr:aldo/keto reductase [Enhygromyxa salina]